MSNVRLLWVSMLALAAALANAQSTHAQATATSSSNVIANYVLRGDVAFDGYTEGDFDYFGVYRTGSDEDGGNAAALINGSTSHSHVDGTDLFKIGSLTSGTLFSADPTRITPGADPYAQSYNGYSYDLTFTAGDAGGFILINLNAFLVSTGSGDSPTGPSSYDPATGAYSPGAYASGTAYVGLFDRARSRIGYVSVQDTTAHESTTSVATSTYDVRETFTDGGGIYFFDPHQTRTITLFAFSVAEADYLAPVPEPAPLLALGVGALGLLRRRRKA